MRYVDRVFFTMTLGLFVLCPVGGLKADTALTTRIETPEAHAELLGGGNKTYRQKADYVMQELDLRAGDVVVDIGAGDGFWAEKLAEAVGPTGTIHAGEVSESLVNKMKERFEGTPHVKPYRCPLDGTGLDENTCDLAFLSKTFHHLDYDGHADYLEHLKSVVRPTGRLVVVEHYRKLSQGRLRDHAWPPGQLINQCEEAGWICLRMELIAGSQHFIAIFVQGDIRH